MNQTAWVGIKGIQKIRPFKHFYLKYKVEHLIANYAHLINTKPTTDGEIHFIESERHAHKDSLSFFCIMVVLVLLNTTVVLVVIWETSHPFSQC